MKIRIVYSFLSAIELLAIISVIFYISQNTNKLNFSLVLALFGGTFISTFILESITDPRNDTKRKQILKKVLK